MSGRCRTCGLVRRYPATWEGISAARREEHRRAAEQAVASLPRLPALSAVPVAEAALAGLANAALDAVFHLRRGPVRHVELIASQLEASPLFQYRFIRALEDVGHIEVARGERLQPEAWEATQPRLVELPESRGYLLVGAIGRGALEQLAAAVEAAGGELQTGVDALGLPRRVALRLDRHVAESVCQAVLRPPGDSLRISLDTSRRLTSLLPPLSNVIEAVETRRIPPHRRAEVFEVGTASWRQVERVDDAGGYRLEGYGVTYALQLPGDRSGSVRIVDARLVRFGAALMAGEALAAYFLERTTLEVPLGSSLPGLYSRAAVLSSGWLPARSEDGRSLCYRDVPSDVAGALIDKLES